MKQRDGAWRNGVAHITQPHTAVPEQNNIMCLVLDQVDSTAPGLSCRKVSMYTSVSLGDK